METFVDLLRKRASDQPDRTAFVFLTDGESEEDRYNFRELERAARRVAARFQELGLAGERALLLFPPGPDYVAAFWGCLFAGVVAVPAYPPRGRRGRPRLAALIDDARPAVVVTNAAGRRSTAAFVDGRSLAVEATDELPGGLEQAWREPAVDLDSLAFLQYTSGSTSAPKGVMLSHRNLLDNERMIQQAFGTTADSVVVSWLPLYHDMGLIGGMLHPVFLGTGSVLLSPVHFLQSPGRWLRAVSRYRATVSGAPNFAYELCANRVGEEEASRLDLGSWEVAFNGAEPVRAGTMERFERVFAASGFRPRAWFPCYGLAEATLLVSGGKPSPEPSVLEVDAGALEEHRVVPRAPAAEGSRRLVSCGTTAAGADVRIVDPGTLEECPRHSVDEHSVGRVGEHSVGEVWVAGPGVARGYWNRPGESAETFGARLAGAPPDAGRGRTFLRTGDLGFLDGGQLYLTGRIKDLIIIRGRNLYPQDVEAVMEQCLMEQCLMEHSHPALRTGCGAAFSVPVDGEERLVLVQEVDVRRLPDASEVHGAVRRAVGEAFEVRVEAVVLIRPGALPKTTSGKVQRGACRVAYLADGFDVVSEWREGDAGSERPLARPCGAREERVLAIWAEVLELDAESFGVDQSFFELGGDSVRAVRLAARLREAFGVELPLEALFDAPTVAETAALLDGTEGPGPADGVARGPRKDALPLTSPQRRLWFLDRLEPGNPAYNLAVAFEWAGALDVALLTRSMAALLRRHDALRAVFRIAGDAPAQRIRRRLEWGPRAADLSRLGAARQRAEAARLEAGFARLPFDLSADVAPRLLLLRLAEERWRLVLSLHHVVSDGTSLGILVSELVRLYRGAAPPELPVGYADYVAWQAERKAAASLEHWRRTLAGPPPLVELPADGPRPAVLGYRGAHRERPLTSALTASLRELGASRGATLFMVLLAGYETLIRRYTGLADVVVGTAVDHRDRKELEGVVGLLVNTLPLRSGAGADPAFEELLSRARRTALDAFAHREVAFETLVDELGGPRDPSHRPLVQVMMVLQSSPPDSGGLGLPVREVDNGTARFDLALSWRIEGGALVGTWKYHRDLFDGVTARRWALHLERLLESAAADPGRRLSELEAWSAGERHQVLAEWSDTAAGEGPGECLHDAVAVEARRRPDAVALVCEDEALSYGELARRSGRLASTLRAAGIGPDVPVGVLMERSTELLVALLGILEAGGAYLPLDPSYPAERLRFMVASARLSLILTHEPLRRHPAATSARRLVLERGGLSAGGPPAPLPEARRAGGVPRGANLAYVIFTSGSTGRPKGVGVPHRGIVNRLVWMQEAYPLTPDDVVLQKTPYSFDVSVWELFWAFRQGARLVVARPGGHHDSAYLADLIAKRRVTTLHFVPSMLQVFVEEPRLAACASLERVIVSGEALPYDLQERFFARCGAELHNLYGPTEASVDVTAWACRRRSSDRVVPLGRPISNIRIHVDDRRGRALPALVPGELAIAGVGLARGYLGRPGLTAERFVADASGREPGGRAYRTGDLARHRGDGTLEFLGRIDHQVKVRGFRIELGEIEAALAGRPEVREAVVLARPELGSSPLVAYVVPAEGSRPTVEELAAHLASRLPEHMVPRHLLVLEAFLLTPSGKVDRRALPAPSEPDAAAVHVAPRHPLEERLAELWRAQLGVARVGVHDDFFELGGDSVAAALLVNRLQRELASVLYVMALFEHPTVARFAAYLKENYSAALAAWLGTAEDTAEPTRLDESDLTLFREALAEIFPSSAGEARKRAPEDGAQPHRAVFLLSPFRSGSTLLRVMLAGHPRLFAPPELELLGFETLAARRDVLTGPLGFAREGLLRALMELHGGDAAAAEARLAAHDGESTRDFYLRLQEWAGGRLLVDKTPRYALDPATLERAERWFEEPLYVHLVRHPSGMVLSYEKARMDQAYPFPLPVRRQAEAIWRISHRNIVDFLDGVPAERWRRVRFEDLVERPRPVMESLAGFLGVPFTEAMLRPYDGERMTDGIVAGGRMMGDPTFHEHRRIDPGVAERWRTSASPAALADGTRDLAEALGYARPAKEAAAEPIGAAERDTEPLLSFGQRRLWFLDRLREGGDPTYNMPGAVHLRGRLDLGALRRTFAEVVRRHEVLRTVFPDTAGRPAQIVSAPRPPALPVIDLAGAAPAVKERESRRLLVREARRPFDLARGPLLRLVLLRLSRREHVLLVALHHIVADGWSVSLLVREVAALYGAFAAGRPSPLAEPAVQYADYAAWQRRRLSGALRAELLDYWRGRLAPPLPVLELPTDRPRPAMPKGRGSRRSVRFSSASTSRLHELARRRGTTLFAVLTALFETFLHRHSGQTDLVVGVPVAHRHRLEVEDLIGFFVNTVALRGDLSGDPPFGRFLVSVREAWQGASRHEEMPFEMLVEELGVRRETSHAPLFQVLFAFQNAPTSVLELPELEIELEELETRTAKFDLLLNLTERGGELTGWLEYATDLFDAATAARLVGRLDALAADAARDDGRPLSRLGLLAAAERHQVVREWNDTAIAGAAAEGLLHGPFLSRAREIPDAVALSFEDVWTSYGEAERRSGRLARRLAALGVGPDVPVGISAERSPELVLGLLSILRAGGAYLPLDPAHPRRRLAFVASRSRAPVVLAQRRVRERLPELGGRLLVLEEELAPREEAGSGELPAVRPEHLAYVLYTSGSTGEPKGVMISHRGIENRLGWGQRTFGLAAADVVLQKTPYTFDVSVWELFWPLREGARLSVLPPGAQQDSAYLAEHVVRERVSVAHFVPSMLQLFDAEPKSAGCTSLRLVVASGEALPAALARRFRGRLDARLMNLYGPTEASVEVSVHACPADDPRPSVPIGRPIAGIRLVVLERGGQPAPAGVPGELVIGGAGLARGYLGSPGLTASSFVPDAESGAPPGERFYRTGDLARTLASGEIDFLGRLDHQVKVRGLRIELGEIEACLTGHPAVRESVVTVREDRPGDPRLVAYLVAAGAAPETGELRRFLGRRLPDYMVPAAYVALEALPLSANGKVDRKALPAPSANRPRPAAGHVSPRNELERVLARIWRELLGLDEVGIHDNFFDLGGHSLLAAEAHARLRQELGVELTLVEALQHPTIHTLSHTLSERLGRRREAPPDSFHDARRAASREKAARRRRALRRRQTSPA